MTNPTYEVCVDWDCADWAGAFDFTTAGDNITSDVKSVKITRGVKADDRIYPAATLEVVLNSVSGNYFPTNSGGDYYGKIRIWLPVRVRAVHNTITYNLFTGFINRITCSPLKSKQEVYFYATDGSDVLAKTIVIQDMDDKTVMTDGAAIAAILDAAGWSATRRSLDVTGGDIINMPDTFAYEKP